MKLVSIVIPAYNEEETLEDVLGDVFSEIEKIKDYIFEVIVVDNNSNDTTARVAKKLGAEVIPEKKAGKGCALITGFKKSRGEYIIMLDADYSHKPEDFQRFLAALHNSADCGLVIGSRTTGGSDEYNTVRALGNIILTACSNFALRINVSDALNGFKAFRRDIFDNYIYTAVAFEIEIELILNCLRSGYRVGEIPSHERSRKGGRMKSFAPVHGIKFFLKIIESGLIFRFFKKKNCAKILN